MTKAETEARRAARFRRQLEGPPRVVAVSTRPESVGYWREKVAATGLDVAVVGDKDSIFPEGDKRARFVFADPPDADEAETVGPPPEEAAPPGAPIRVTVHNPDRRQTVRIETGPWGTEIHLDG